MGHIELADMDEEHEFLREISDRMAGAALLSASLRWGIEGTLDNRVDLPELSVRLQELVEHTLAMVEARRRKLGKQSSA
jgi:hypothetical protein